MNVRYHAVRASRAQSRDRGPPHILHVNRDKLDACLMQPGEEMRIVREPIEGPLRGGEAGLNRVRYRYRLLLYIFALEHVGGCGRRASTVASGPTKLAQSSVNSATIRGGSGVVTVATGGGKFAGKHA